MATSDPDCRASRTGAVRSAMAIAAVVAGYLLTPPALALDNLPGTGKEVSDFVPASWTIESRLEGDLTGDGLPDVVLVLLRDEGKGVRGRALVVLARQERGFKLLGSNDAILSCYGCGGIKNVLGAPDISIQKGVLVVMTYGGSREFWSYTFRFRRHPASARLMLIGFDQVDSDSATGEGSSTSTNYLTGTEIVAVSLAGREPSREVTKVPKRTIFLEDARLPQ